MDKRVEESSLDCALCYADLTLKPLCSMGAAMDQLCKHLGRIFGSCSADEAGTTLTVEVDSKSAEIALPGLTVKSEDTAWAQHLTVVSRRFRMTVKPEFR